MDQSLTELVPRMLLSMGVVMGVMWIAARVITKRGLSGKALGIKRETAMQQVRVLSRQNVGRRASVAVVRAAGKTMVVGVTDNNVSLLSDITLDMREIALDDEHEFSEPHWTGAPADATTTSSQAWTGLLSQIRERTVRRS